MPKKLLLLLASTFVALLFAEGGTRLWLRARGEPYDASAAERECDEVLSKMTGVLPVTADADGEDEAKEARGLRYTLHPYTAFTLNLNLAVVEDVVRRFHEEASSNDPGDFDIFFLGGSVASIFCGQEGGSAWLEEQLEADSRLAGRNVRFHRFAIPGYKQPQQLTGFAYLLSRGCRPELVINLDGLNEVRQGVRNASLGVQPTWPSIGHWTKVTEGDRLDPESIELIIDIGVAQRAAHAEASRARRWGLLRSAISGRIVLSRMAHARDVWTRAQQRYVQNLVDSKREDRNRPFGIEPEAGGALEKAVACWRESSLAIQNLCTPLGIRYLHVLQPTLHDEGSKPITEQERRKGIGERGFDKRVKEGYALLRAGCLDLAEHGVESHDLSYAFESVAETLYYDECHFNRAGNLVLAEHVLELVEGML